MTKPITESALNKILEKLTYLETKISLQTTVITEQSKKIEEQLRVITSNGAKIEDQKRVIQELSAKVQTLVCVSVPEKTKSAANKATGSESAKKTDAQGKTASRKTPVEAESERALRANSRANKKEAAATTVHERQRKDGEGCKQDPQRPYEKEDEKEFILVESRKAKKLRTPILQGRNKDTNVLQAIKKKKFLHLWSLHPDTKEDILLEYVQTNSGTKDVSVEKINPKTKRGYSSFLIGVPETCYEKISKTDMWPVNAKFSEWIWFRSSRKQGTQA
ncbi:hypothetical protein O0L34_g19487 [Tuta absoluta]|nr:hypothetical protein O0L34_g19479 [Tuta absoluta]KAJ2937318.1 hypothetical protein O0L34_g19487 [Tuta absoluta]